MENTQRIVSFLPNYLICIDKILNGDLLGRVYGGAESTIGFAFKDIVGMINILEEIMDNIECPQAALESRNFNKTKEKAQKKLSREEIRRVFKAMRNIDENLARGEKATFILQIKFRQNASWQGSVQWVEKKQTLHFRSALELIKIIDSACEQGYEAEVIEFDKNAM